jgi:hypothetical protein
MMCYADVDNCTIITHEKDAMIIIKHDLRSYANTRQRR